MFCLLVFVRVYVHVLNLVRHVIRSFNAQQFKWNFSLNSHQDGVTDFSLGVFVCVCVRFHTLDTFRFTHVALQPHNIKYALQCSVLVNWFVHTAPAHIHSYNYFLESIWINRSIDNFRCGQIRIHLWQGVHQQAFSPSSFSIVDFSRIVCFAFIVFFRFLLVLILLLWKLFKW